MGIPLADIPVGPYLVDFRGGVGSLPHVHATTLLQQQLTGEFVRDRVVLLGRAEDALSPGLATPTTNRSRRMSLLEYHGHALNTILTGRAIHLPGRTLQFCLDFAVALICVTILRQSTVRSGVTLMLGLLAASSCVAWIVLHHFQVWIGLPSVLLIALLSAVLVLDRRLKLAGASWRRLSQMGFAASPRYRNHPPLPISGDPWQDTALMLDQLFDIQRAALLIVRRGRRRLQLVHQLRCSAGDLQEKNRNIRRPPYADAIEQRGLLQVDTTRPFFHLRPHEQQFLVPLLYRGQTKGILALATTPDAVHQTADFADLVRTAADELGELIARREAVQDTARRESSWVRRLGSIPEQRMNAGLERHLGLVNRRLSQCCRAIEESFVGDALYDVSGWVVSMNGTMFRQLQADGVNVMELPLVELINALAGCGLEHARRLLRDVVLQHHRVSVPLPATDSRRASVLRLQPLDAAAPASEPAWSFDLFRLQGVHVQLLLEDPHPQQPGDERPSSDRSLPDTIETREKLEPLVQHGA